MPELKVGTVVGWQNLSSVLATFSLMPERGSRFPDYKPGQYIALRRENCRLTKRVIGADGRPDYLTDLDESGKPKLGPVTHSYSVASAPFETREKAHLDFYIIRETDTHGELGRLTASLFRIDPPADDKIIYVNNITGSFTLDRRAKGFESVFLIGSGTGLAPFVSMIKQLYFEASHGAAHRVQCTLLHANRTYEELAYHQELTAIAASARFDCLYLPSVSRPKERDFEDPHMGRGRANNLLRHILGMPLKEEQQLQEVLARGDNPSGAGAALDSAVVPALPTHLSRAELQKRLDPARTVILTCGNPSFMADVKYVAEVHRIRFEKEDW